MGMNTIQPGPTQQVAPVFRAGLMIGVIAAAYNMILAATGLYTNTALGWAVLGIEYLGVAWIMIHRDSDGRFVRNLLVGTIGVAAIALVLAPSTWLQCTFVVPDYADVIVVGAVSQWESLGLDAAEVAARADRLRQNYTPVRQAWFVFVGTFLTVIPVVVLLAGGLLLYGRRSRARRS